MDGDMKQPEDDVQSIQMIKQPDQTKERKKGGDADSGNSEEEEDKKEEEKCCSDDDEKCQEEDCKVSSSEKKQEAQTTEQPEDTNTEVHNQQKESEKEHKGEGDHIETIGITATADTFTQNTEQPEATDTEVHTQQKESEKDTIGVSGQSDDQLDLDTTDGKCIKPKDENNEVLQAGEGLRKSSSNKNQKIEHKGDGDNIETRGITATADTSRQDTEQPEDTNTEVHNQQKESEKGQDTEQPEDTDTEVHNQQKESEKEHKGDGDHIETIGIPATADTSRQDTEQPEDTDTEVHNQQKESEKDTTGVTGQSDDQLDLDMTDGKCIKPKDENNEVLQAGEGLRKRSSNKNQKIEHKGEGDHIEIIETTATADTARSFAILLVLIAFSVVAWWLWQTSSSSLQKDLNLLEVFHQEMDKVQASFPSQHPELWRRSRIHLRKHLNLTDPTEPVSLILTSGRGAEKTLGCLAQQLAAAFSKALNSTFLGIDGTSKTAQDSDQVKLDIDKALKEAFEGGKQAAVIHRFEELPPGSTLIFYRYCDHENAAFKKVFLAFTVMFPEKMDFQPNVSLGMVEELVQDYLKDKFVLSDRIAKFNQMDLDKLGGLWSRISHVILPVTAELKIEQHGCQP